MTLFEPPNSSGWSEHNMPDFGRPSRWRRPLLLSALLTALPLLLILVVVNTPLDPLRNAIFGAPEPTPEVIALADRLFVTQDGRDILYATAPTLGDTNEVRAECTRLGQDNSRTAGCFRSDGRIFIYQPVDPRLDAAVVTTTAHELLHAVYERLAPAERDALPALLEAEIARVPAEDPIHEQLEYSIGIMSTSRVTELFAYLGSQVRPDGGFAPELETIYARYFTDRAALVQVYRDYGALFEGAVVELDAAWNELASQETANAQERAQLDADARAHEVRRTGYNADADHFNSLSPEERPRWQLTIERTDGTTVTLSYEEGLAVSLQELEQFRIEIADRRAALETAEAAAAQRRSELEVRHADVEALIESASGE